MLKVGGCSWKVVEGGSIQNEGFSTLWDKKLNYFITFQ